MLGLNYKMIEQFSLFKFINYSLVSNLYTSKWFISFILRNGFKVLLDTEPVSLWDLCDGWFGAVCMITMITAVTEQHIAVIFSTLTDLTSRRYYSHHILDKIKLISVCPPVSQNNEDKIYFLGLKNVLFSNIIRQNLKLQNTLIEERNQNQSWYLKTSA